MKINDNFSFFSSTSRSARRNALLCKWYCWRRWEDMAFIGLQRRLESGFDSPVVFLDRRWKYFSNGIYFISIVIGTIIP